MFSWNVEASFVTHAKKEAVWKLWSDVPNWPKWDDGLEWCRIDGPFAVGSKGELKPEGAPKVRFIMTDVRPMESYSDLSFLPLTQLIFTHTMECLPNGKIMIRHRARCKGLLAPLLWLTLRKDLKKGMPRSIQSLARLAETGEG